MFVAVDIDEPLRRQVSRVQDAVRAAAPGAKWVDPALCHLTLKFLGSVPAGQVADIGAGCRRAAAGATPFELVFGGIGAFPRWRGARVLWMGITGGRAPLSALQASVEAELAPLGFPPEARPFSPHLTLARFKQPPPRTLQDAAGACEHQAFGSVPIQDARLIRSDLRSTGPVYTLLEAFPLGT